MLTDLGVWGTGRMSCHGCDDSVCECRAAFQQIVRESVSGAVFLMIGTQPKPLLLNPNVLSAQLLVSLTVGGKVDSSWCPFPTCS